MESRVYIVELTYDPNFIPEIVLFVRISKPHYNIPPFGAASDRCRKLPLNFGVGKGFSCVLGQPRSSHRLLSYEIILCLEDLVLCDEHIDLAAVVYGFHSTIS